MYNTFPRVLLVNQQSIKKNNATGITLRSLWEDWPLECLMEIYLDKYETHVDFKPELKSFCLPSNWLSRLAHSGSARKINSEIKQEEIVSNKSFKSSIRQAVVFALDMIPSSVPTDIYSQIDDFKPEIIYTLGASVSTLDLANRISKKYSIPIVIHYMDNWPENLQWDDNPFIKPYRRKLDKKHRSCLSQSVMGIAISPYMAEEYVKKFKMPFVSIMNSVNIDEFHLIQKPICEPIRFVYAGGLHLNRWKALQGISSAIKDTGINAELHIYTNNKNKELYQSLFVNNTYFHENVDHTRIIEIYRDADVLVHAETNNPRLLGFFKYSISTKIPEYLSSGRLVLFYGPKDLGLYRYLSDNNIAYVASNYQELYETLVDIGNFKMSETILKNALRVATENHNSKTSRITLKNTINICVEKYKELLSSEGNSKWV